ncbi:MAG: hypothetical protein O7E52_23525 [Candidatus Poribacteria bacterium]|nr:hypothetical protein [Candidatus Poribacteria bacterium]
MLKCESIQTQQSSYLDREMPMWKVGLIQWHLKRCPTCAHEVIRLQQTDRMLRELDSVKTADRFLSDVMRQVSTISVNEKQQSPLLRRLLRRLDASFAWARYRLQTRARPYAVATALVLVMTAASVVTLYQPRWLLLPSEDAPILAQSHGDKPVVLVEFEIVSIDRSPKPHLSVDRHAPSPANP